MPRRRRQPSAGPGSLDSLLDTMTNVVGILIVVLIVTQMNVTSAARRIRQNLPEVSVAMMQELRNKEMEQRRRLDELRSPPETHPRELASLRNRVRELEQRAASARREADTAREIESQLAALDKTVQDLKKQHHDTAGELARVREKLATGQARARARNPELVRLPNPRLPHKDAVEVRFIASGNRLLRFDHDAILNHLASRVKPQRRLLSKEDPKRYDREKLRKFLDTLKNSHPDYRFEFRFAHNGHVYADCFPKDGRGESAPQLANPKSTWWRLRATARAERQYFRFWVTPDSFEIYLKARAMADEFHIPAGWEFADQSARQTVHLWHRRILATPHPDWKPPPTRPPPKTPKKKPPRQPPKKPPEDILD